MFLDPGSKMATPCQHVMPKLQQYLCKLWKTEHLIRLISFFRMHSTFAKCQLCVRNSAKIGNFYPLLPPGRQRYWGMSIQILW